MELINVFIGLGLGSLCLLPGLGVPLIMLILIGLGFNENIIIYTLLTGLLVNTVKEGAAAECGISGVSSNVFISTLPNSTSSLNNYTEFTKNIIINKVIAWGIGIGLGLIIPSYIFGEGSGLVISIICVLIVLSTLGTYWYVGVMWLCSVGVISILTLSMTDSDPIYIIGCVVFMIPNLLFSNSDLGDIQPEPIYSTTNVGVNWLTILFSLLISVVSPGVSPPAIVSIVNGYSYKNSTLLSIAAMEPLIEGFGLVHAINGFPLGKSILSNYVLNPSIWSIVTLTIVVIAAGSLSLFYVELYKPLADCPSLLVGTSLIVSLGSVVLFAGFSSLLLIPLGLVCYQLGRGLPSPVKGLAFFTTLLS